MSIIGSNILAGASGQGGSSYTIENSLRLRSSASAYLNRTPASAGNRTTWTYSAWVKRGKLGAQQYLLQARISDGGNNTDKLSFFFNTNDALYVFSQVTAFRITNAVFRDPSAWYHIVLVGDTSNATPNNRLRLYVNNVEQTYSTLNNPTVNLTTAVNAVASHQIGAESGPATYFDGYLAEVNFIDGQALTPSDFGEYNADTGVWQPVGYAGTYGANGFYLPFSDATNTTTLVADSSGNGNDWTPNNISLTSGATYDSMTDTPTIYAGGGNYCTLSPIFVGRSDAGGVYGATNGNLTGVNIGAGGWAMMGSTMVIPAASAKYYFECTVGAAPQTMSVGVQKAGTPFAAPYIVGYSGDANGYSYANDGYKFNNGSSAYGSTATVNDVIGVAIDASGATSSIEFYKNGVSMGVAFTGISGGLMPALSTTAAAGNCHMNFGQRPFAYTPPTGFLPLHTGNLPDSAIVDGSQYFDTQLFTGTSPTSQSITNLEFQPDFVWFKNRSGANNHALYDSVRGRALSLLSNATNSEITSSAGNDLVSFDTNGFTVGTVQNHTSTNGSGASIVAWNWKANGAGVSNTDGSITSTVSANTDAGFSIVTYTGNGAATATIGHGLGATPDMIITFGRTGGSTSHAVYHSALTNASSSIIWLDLNLGAVTNAGYWNSTAPTSTVFSGGASGNYVNNTGWTMVAYCFAEVEGYSKFGSYTGNGSANGPFVHLGFKPRFIMLKSTSSGYNWVLYDTERDTYNAASTQLLPNEAWSEATIGSSWLIDVLSNGFKLRVANGDANGSVPYIYMAFAENPFKNSLAR